MKDWSRGRSAQFWGYSGVNEPKEIWLSSEQEAEEVIRHFPVPVGANIPRLGVGEIHVQKVDPKTNREPWDIENGLNRWRVVTHGWYMGVPAYTFTSAKGVVLTVPLGVDSRGRIADPDKTPMPSFWTWAYKNGLQEAAKEALTEAVVAPKPLAPGDRTLDNTGHCAACLANVKLSHDTIMRHGWSVQGDRGRGQYGNSWHTGPCIGAGYLPWELSPKGAEVYLAQLVGIGEQLQRKLQNLRGNPKEIPNVRYREYSRVVQKKVLVETDSEYKDILKLLIEQQEQDLRYLDKDITDLKTRIGAWVPKALYGKVATRWMDGQHG